MKKAADAPTTSRFLGSSTFPGPPFFICFAQTAAVMRIYQEGRAPFGLQGPVQRMLSYGKTEHGEKSGNRPEKKVEKLLITKIKVCNDAKKSKYSAHL